MTGMQWTGEGLERLADPLRIVAYGTQFEAAEDSDAFVAVADWIDAEHSRRMDECRREAYEEGRRIAAVMHVLDGMTRGST